MDENPLDQVSGDRIEEHIRSLEGVRHPVAAPEALERAADYVLSFFESLGYQVETHFFTEGGREYRNLVATHQGVSHPDQRVLIVAHYDTVEGSPGADDNASGVAVLLELARVLEPVGLEKTVQFVAVNLEEPQGEGQSEQACLCGSRALAAEAEKRGWEIEGAIVLESIAYAGQGIAQKAPPGLPIRLPELGDFIAVVGNEASRELVETFVEVVAQHLIPLPVAPLVVPGKGEMLPDSRRSDHAAFWDKGYRAVMLTDTANFRNPHYHEPTDMLGTLNLSFAADVCRAVAGTVLHVARYVGTL